MPKEGTGYYIKCIAYESRRILDENAEKSGLTSTQAYILWFLYRSERTGEKVRQCDLEKWINIRASSVTGMLVGMEKAGFIVRTNSEEDVRAKNVELTDYGRELALQSIERMKEMEEKMLGGFTPDEKSAFRDMLKKVLYNLKN